jgi:hypothetical protein
MEHDWVTDYECANGENWGFTYKELKLKRPDIESLIKIVECAGDNPSQVVMPKISSFHQTIKFVNEGNVSHLKFSTVDNVCEWSGSSQVPPEDLCHKLVEFLQAKGFDTFNNEAARKAKARALNAQGVGKEGE